MAEWKLWALILFGGGFALAGLGLLVYRSSDATQTHDAELFGLKFRISSSGLVVFLVGAAFLAAPLVIEVLPRGAVMEKELEARLAALREEVSREPIELPSNIVTDGEFTARLAAIQEQLLTSAVEAAGRQAAGLLTGAVVAFDLPLEKDKCPEGWSPFREARARVIVGAGDPSQAAETRLDERGRPLEGYAYRQPGGEQVHVLTKQEIPKHTHGGNGLKDLHVADNIPYLKGPMMNSSSVDFRLIHEKEPWPSYANQDKSPLLMTSYGGGQPHNNMPPFIPLHYCKKN